MHAYVEQIKQNLTQLFHNKRQVALSLMPETKQRVFHCIAPLLHLNHPQLPGYIDDVPYGIINYQLSEPLKMELSHYFNISLDVLDAAQKSSRPPIISALYSMGSTGTIGQTLRSDLDIWVCIEVGLSDDTKHKLKQKMALIEAWAISLDAPLHFYLVDVNRFRQNHHDCLTQENCGSTQHVLLLEEFYRSAFWLAGKWLLWYLIPDHLTLNQVTYESYDQLVHHLMSTKQIDAEEWIDFGQLTQLSLKEYFGAGLWQLYQCIDSPFKSTLKAILLESYVKSSDPLNFLAFEVRQRIQSGDLSYKHSLDAYVMLFDRVTHYLKSVDDQRRLHLAQCCFYIKIDPHLSEKDAQSFQLPHWKKVIVSTYVANWQWDQDYIYRIDSFKRWPIRDLRQLDIDILHAVMGTYKKLLEFARIYNIETSIDLTDLSILTRKLYAAYEESTDKIKLMNQALASTISERALTFIHVDKPSINVSGWYLYNSSPEIEEITRFPSLIHFPRLVKLLAWCHFNYLLMPETEIFSFEQGMSSNHRIRYIFEQLKENLSTSRKVEDDALLLSSQVVEVMIFINSETVMHRSLKHLSDHEIEALDVLNYGVDERSLIDEIDIIYKNSWGEIKHLYFSGTFAVLDALRSFVKKIHKKSQFPSVLRVVSVPTVLRKSIENSVNKLFTKAIQYRLMDNQEQRAQFMPLRLNGQSWYLFFERFGLSVHQFGNKLALFNAVATNKIKGRALDEGEVRDILPREIDQFANEGVIQFFFDDLEQEKGFDLYILNEHNQVEIFRNCNANKDRMIREASHFYMLTNERAGASRFVASPFNLPQFYQMMKVDEQKRMIIPYHLC